MEGSATPSPVAPEDVVSSDGRTVQLPVSSTTEQPTAILPPPSPGSGPTLATHAGASARPRVPPSLGPYELLDELGQGGMGIVYRARHRELGSLCAVKILIAGEHASPAAIARFHREAGAVARMGKHPNIISVFDMGTEGNLAYYAMELVPGRSLASLLRERRPTLAEAALLVEKVARALHHAHRHGVIHRDVKPDNIVLREDGEPQVMDFGLAREVGGGERLSVTGEVMGTPAYMAPEQARGLPGATDARTDVYALGAVLYEMIAGRPVRSGGTVFEMIEKVVVGEVVPPRRLRADLPPDLETVCMKCLEVDPSRRYATAEAVAEDLARFLRGEPVLARPVPAAERLIRWVRKRRHVVLPLAAAALIVGLAGVWGLVLHLRNLGAIESALGFGRRFREQGRPREARDAFREALVLDGGCAEARDGQEWADERVAELELDAVASRRRADEAQQRLEKMEAVSRVLGRWSSLHRPLREMERAFHADDATVEERRARAAEGWKRVEAFMSQTPDDAASQATMRAFAGWARRLAGEETEGLEWMRLAADLDKEVPYGRLLEALVWFSAYVERQSLPPTVTTPTGVEAGDVPEDSPRMAELRGRISARLGEVEGSPIWGRTGGQGFRSALSAMRAMQAEKYDRAEADLTAAMEDPDLRCFEAGLLIARSRARYLRNDFRGALEDLEEATAARSEQAEVRSLRGVVKLGLGVQISSRGGDPRPILEEAVADFGDAVRLSSVEASHYHDRARAWRQLGRAEAMRGEDPRKSYARAIEDVEEAALRGDAGPDAEAFRGLLHRTLGEAQAARGEDPRESYRRAIEGFTRGLEGAEADPTLLSNRGGTWALLGDAEGERGGDEGACLKKAIEDYDAAIQKKPDYAVALNNRALAYRALGVLEAGRGGDPRPLYERAIEGFDAAVALDPAYASPLSHRGSTRGEMGDAEQARGGDPQPWYRKGIEDHTEAITRNPGDAVPRDNRGILWYKLGEVQARTGQDPRESFRNAITDEDEALRINPKHANGWLHRGHARRGLAEAEAARGGDPREGLKAAVADYDGSIRCTPSSAVAWAARGNVTLHLGREEAARGGALEDSCRRALADFDSAIERNPKYWKAHLGRGEALELQGRNDDAIQAYRQVLQAVPRQPQATQALQRLEGK